MLGSQPYSFIFVSKCETAFRKVSQSPPVFAVFADMMLEGVKMCCCSFKPALAVVVVFQLNFCFCYFVQNMQITITKVKMNAR